jgi:plasmid maintenance system antidote protein VapI
MSKHNTTKVKLSYERAEKIRLLYFMGGWTQAGIAQLCHVHTSTINAIVLNKTWILDD